MGGNNGVVNPKQSKVINIWLWKNIVWYLEMNEDICNTRIFFKLQIKQWKHIEFLSLLTYYLATISDRDCFSLSRRTYSNSMWLSQHGLLQQLRPVQSEPSISLTYITGFDEYIQLGQAPSSYAVLLAIDSCVNPR